MAARAIWKGSIELGRSHVPVKLYSAVQDRTVHFHLLEKRTHARVKQHMVNPATGKEVRNDEIRKGYEIEADTFVIVDDDDLSRIEPDPSTEIGVQYFVPEGGIAHQLYDRPYYLGPDADAKSYFALAEALSRAKREGLAHWVMRKKEYVGALRARDGYLLLITLRYSNEVLSAQELPAPAGKAPDAREIKMAEQLVSTLEDEFRPEDYADKYRERVLKYIEAKAKGRKPRLETIPARREPASLVDALAASLKSTARPAGKEKAVA
ncbi:MAG: Ku protein [Bryobacteraceae bacterium]